MDFNFSGDDMKKELSVEYIIVPVSLSSIFNFRSWRKCHYFNQFRSVLFVSSVFLGVNVCSEVWAKNTKWQQSQQERGSVISPGPHSSQKNVASDSRQRMLASMQGAHGKHFENCRWF